MTPIVPVVISGGRTIQVALPRAIEMIREGLGRFLPLGPKFVGSQSAGPNASGPFYGNFTTNMTPAARGYNLVGQGLAGAGAAASVATGGPGSFRGMDRPQGIPDEVRPPVYGPGDRLVEPMRASQPIAAPPPAEAGPDYGSMGGPDMLQRALAMTAAPAKRAAPVPMPPRRPVEMGRPVERASEPSSRALWDRYNESGNMADMILADRAMRAGRAEGGGIPMGMRGMEPPAMPNPELPPMPEAPKPSTGPGGRDAAINKALEIIHHLIIRGA